MKPKQKGKRGASKYSLDIYTDLTVEECIKKLNVVKSSRSLHYIFSMAGNSNQFTIIETEGEKLLPIKTRFEGLLEPSIVGTRVYGRVYRTYDFYTMRVIGELGIGLWMTGMLFAVALALRDAENSYLMVICAAPMLFVLYLTLVWYFEVLAIAPNLLRWIEEQLNIEEKAYETKTKA